MRGANKTRKYLHKKEKMLALKEARRSQNKSSSSTRSKLPTVRSNKHDSCITDTNEEVQREMSAANDMLRATGIIEDTGNHRTNPMDMLDDLDSFAEETWARMLMERGRNSGGSSNCSVVANISNIHSNNSENVDSDNSRSRSVSSTSKVVAEGPFWTLPFDVFHIIMDFVNNDYVKMAQVSRLYDEWTRLNHERHLVSRMSAAGGVLSVCDRFVRSFADKKHELLRDEIIANLLTLVRSRKQGIDCKNAGQIVNLFLQFKRPTAELYDLLFGRGAYKDKLEPDDLLQLQRLFADNVEMLTSLICSSDGHLEDLRIVLTIEMVNLTESKCAIMAKVLMGTGFVPVGPLKVLADTIRPNLMEITSGLNFNAPFPVIVKVYNRLKSEGGQCAILADKLIDVINHGFDLYIANRNAQFRGLDNQVQIGEKQCATTAYTLTDVIEYSVELCNASEISRVLGLPSIDGIRSVDLDIYLLLDHKFTEKHQFTFEQCAQTLKSCSTNYLFGVFINSGTEATLHSRQLLRIVLSDSKELEMVEWQFIFQVVILEDITSFSKWEQLCPLFIADVAAKQSNLSPYITDVQCDYILSKVAPNLLNCTSRDDLMVSTYFYLTSSNRRAFISRLTPKQVVDVLHVVIRDHLEEDVLMLFKGAAPIVSAPLCAYVSEHPDYVPDASILPIIFWFSENEAVRVANRRRVTVTMLEDFLYSLPNTSTEHIASAWERFGDFYNGLYDY